MKKLIFSKMHGLGNDFIVVDALRQPAVLETPLIARLADRNQGIGFDQLLLILASKTADLRCQIFNADGSEAEQCGNGLRCVARYVHEEGICRKNKLRIETQAGLIAVEIEDYERIRVNMGVPELETKPLVLSVDDSELSLTLLSLGNPHAIQRVNACQNVPVSRLGRQIEALPLFSRGVNVGFMEVLDRGLIRLRTYERGVGETLACGSNACAAVVAGISQNWLDSRVEVSLARGHLEVEWAGLQKEVYLTGPAARVFSGEVTL